MINVYEAAAINRRKSLVVVVLFFLFVALSVYILSNAFSIFLGYEPGGLGIVGIALIISGIASLFSYYYSDRIILSISKARPADRNRDFDFYTISENLSIASGLPKPKLYVMDDPAPNAFATGRDPKNAVVCVTTGLMQKLNRTELEGVVAHELSHIKNYDTRLMSIVSVMVGVLAILGDWFLRAGLASRGGNSRGRQADLIFIVLGVLFAIFSPIIAKLIQMAISRRIEFRADAGAVAITRQPSGLMSALDKISQDNTQLRMASKATAHLFIDHPFKKKTKSAVSFLSGLFNTHPPISARIEAIGKMT